MQCPPGCPSPSLLQWSSKEIHRKMGKWLMEGLVLSKSTHVHSATKCDSAGIFENCPCPLTENRCWQWYQMLFSVLSSLTSVLTHSWRTKCQGSCAAFGTVKSEHQLYSLGLCTSKCCFGFYLCFEGAEMDNYLGFFEQYLCIFCLAITSWLSAGNKVPVENFNSLFE